MYFEQQSWQNFNYLSLYILVNIQIEHQYVDLYGSQLIVTDNGSGIVKAGFAGEDHLCAVFSSFIAYPSYSNQMIDVNNIKNKNAVFQNAFAFSAFAISFSRLIWVYSSFYNRIYIHIFIFTVIVTFVMIVFTILSVQNHGILYF